MSDTAQKAIAPAKSKGGRPNKWNPRTKKRILDAVRDGLALVHACRIGGLSFAAFSSHRNRDARFREALEEAIAERSQTLLRVIKNAAKDGDWKASAHLLSITSSEYTKKPNGESPHIHVSGEKVLIYLPQKQNVAQIEND